MRAQPRLKAQPLTTSLSKMPKIATRQLSTTQSDLLLKRLRRTSRALYTHPETSAHQSFQMARQELGMGVSHP
jgi:hypothetical protein